MNFKPELLTKVLNEEKTQTRRIKKPGETCELQAHRSDTCVLTGNNRLKWAVGREYAVAPGRGKHGQGRIKIRFIGEARACDISEGDARAEGFNSRAEFLEAWDAINGKGHREDPVWVIVFQLVKAVQKAA